MCTVAADDALIRLILGITIILLAYSRIRPNSIHACRKRKDIRISYQLPELLTTSNGFDGDPNTLNYTHNPSLSLTSDSRWLREGMVSHSGDTIATLNYHFPFPLRNQIGRLTYLLVFVFEDISTPIFLILLSLQHQNVCLALKKATRRGSVSGIGIQAGAATGLVYAA